MNWKNSDYGWVNLDHARLIRIRPDHNPEVWLAEIEFLNGDRFILTHLISEESVEKWLKIYIFNEE